MWRWLYFLIIILMIIMPPGISNSGLQTPAVIYSTNKNRTVEHSCIILKKTKGLGRQRDMATWHIWVPVNEHKGSRESGGVWGWTKREDNWVKLRLWNVRSPAKHHRVCDCIIDETVHKQEARVPEITTQSQELQNVNVAQWNLSKM